MSETIERAAALDVNTDAKAMASLDLAQVVEATANNFPNPLYRPRTIAVAGHYKIKEIPLPNPFIDPGQSDGTGTKPEFAERLYDLTGDPIHLETLAFDAFAMVVDDVAREGKFSIGVTNVIDVNSAADTKAMSALARGAKAACDKAKVALLGGETAELGYRISGWGEFRLNWNADAKAFVILKKLITGKDLKVGQPIVALREVSSRSNGFTDHRNILETDWLYRHNFRSRDEFAVAAANEAWGTNLNSVEFISTLDRIMGHPSSEQFLVPWHVDRTDVATELLRPSTLYSRLIYEAQGGVDKKPKVELVAAAHISGGGVPGKVGRMLTGTGLGAYIDGSVFPDPKSIQMIMDIVRSLPEEGRNLMTEQKGCQKWGRGFGFVVVTPDNHQAESFIQLAKEQGYQAAIAGHVTNQPTVEFKGFSWAVN